MLDPQTNYKNSFPSYLSNKELIIKFLIFKIYTWRDLIFIVEGEIVKIPIRIYTDPPNDLFQKILNPTERLVLACLMIRHHNGFIREKYLKQIVTSNEKWVIPYIILLIGEYVIEILKIILDNIDEFDKDNFKEFILNNEEYFRKTKDKVRSYWNCYYRRQSPNFNNYIGQKIIIRLEEMLD